MDRKVLMVFSRRTLGNGPDAFGWWRTSARSAGMELDVAFAEDIVLRYSPDGAVAVLPGIGVLQPDCVVMRCYDFALSRHFEAKGVHVVNSTEAMMLSHDKIMTHQRLVAAGLPSPETLRLPSDVGYDEVAEMLGDDVMVVKQLDGSKGANVFLVRNAEEYGEAVHAIGAQCFIAQRYVASSHGRDVRVWVVDGVARAAVLRSSSSRFVSNYSQGGEACLYPLSEEVAALAAAAANALGLFFCGVDLLFTDDGFCVCEVNGNAAFRSLPEGCGVDLPAVFMRSLAAIFQ